MEQRAELDPDVRIVVVRSWDTEARTFEFIALNDSRLDCYRSLVAVFAELALHGAVLFEVNPYDPEPPSPWNEEPANEPQIWLARILIAAPMATLLLRDPMAEQPRLICAGQWNTLDGFFTIALCEVLTDAEKTKPAGGAVIRPGVVQTGAQLHFPVRFGDGSVLELRWPEGLAHPQRDWIWAWRPTIGPILFWVYVDHTASELATWFATTQPNGYEEIEKYKYRHTGELHAQIEIADGCISWARAMGTPPPSLIEADAALLRALREGVLGPISWDLYDGDYHFREATGADAQSLTEYLDPTSDETALRTRWKEQLAERYIDAAQAADLDEVASSICTELWNADRETASAQTSGLAGLLEWLRSSAGASCPLYLRVRMPMRFMNTPELKALWWTLTKARRRIQWAWQFKS